MRKLFTIIFLFVITTQVNAQLVTGGHNHALFVCTDSIPYSCGNNIWGDLGYGICFGDTATPGLINSLTGIIAVGAGDDHSVFLKSDGTVWSCGQNQKGQLGCGTRNDTCLIVQTQITEVTAISVGGDNSLFLKNDSTVWGTGYNGTTYDSIPTQINGLSGVIAIAESNPFIFLKYDSTVWSCQNFLSAPIQVNGLASVISISAGTEYFLALKKDGTVWAWGNNQFGELGDGTKISKSSPVQSLIPIGIAAVSAAGYCSLFLSNSGDVWTCGDNCAMYDSIPFQINSLSNILSICGGASSYEQAFCVKNDGTVWAWGFDNYGQLGIGSYTTSPVCTPTQVILSCNVSAVEENTMENLISLFPNPSSDFINVTYKSKTKNLQFEILDMMGRKITDYKSQSTNSEQTQINISKLPQGLYLLKVTDGDLQFAKRFVKE